MYKPLISPVFDGFFIGIGVGLSIILAPFFLFLAGFISGMVILAKFGWNIIKECPI